MITSASEDSDILAETFQGAHWIIEQETVYSSLLYQVTTAKTLSGDYTLIILKQSSLELWSEEMNLQAW